jgi:hypothetical protein
MATHRHPLAVFVTAMTVAVGGAGWMTWTWDDVMRPGVVVHSASPAPTGFWTRERTKQAEPAEMPVAHPCEGLKSLFAPDCW